MKWLAQGTKDGRLDFGDYNRRVIKDYLAKNGPVRIELNVLTPESGKMRNFFEGAVIPLITYFQEGMSHRNTEDRKIVREWVLREFNGEFRVIGGKSTKVAKTSKGELSQGLTDRIIDWIEEQYGVDRFQVLDPAHFKKFRDEIYSTSEFVTYIDYLISLRRLK